MVKLQPTFLIDKYNNSLDKWILAIPVFDNGVLKLRCCMSRKQQGVFTDIYTYNIDKCRNVLLDFLTEESYGQAYHKFIRLLKDRDDFIVESDHEKGFFTMEDIKNIMFIGKTAYICNVVQKYIDERNNNDDDFDFDFDFKGIKESDRKTVGQLYQEKQEYGEDIPLEEMGYNY